MKHLVPTVTSILATTLIMTAYISKVSFELFALTVFVSLTLAMILVITAVRNEDTTS